MRFKNPHILDLQQFIVPTLMVGPLSSGIESWPVLSGRLLTVVWWHSVGSCIFPFLFSLFVCSGPQTKAAGFIPGVIMNISNLRDLIFPKQKVIWHLSNNDYIQPSSLSVYKSATEDTVYLSTVLPEEDTTMAIH